MSEAFGAFAGTEPIVARALGLPYHGHPNL